MASNRMYLQTSLLPILRYFLILPTNGSRIKPPTLMFTENGRSTMEITNPPTAIGAVPNIEQSTKLTTADEILLLKVSTDLAKHFSMIKSTALPMKLWMLLLIMTVIGSEPSFICFKKSLSTLSLNIP